MICHACKNPLDTLLIKNTPVPRSLECPVCHADARVCLNCEYYEPGRHWDCKEQIPDAINNKSRANFCDYFLPAKTTDKAILLGNREQTKRDQARKAVVDLFGASDPSLQDKNMKDENNLDFSKLFDDSAGE